MLRILALVGLVGCTRYTPPGGGADDDVDGNGPCVGHDEDRDGLTDNCDNCPGTFNPDQTDLIDGDHIGSACDPQIETPNQLLAFDPLTDLIAWHQSSSFTNDGENAVSAGPFAIIERMGVTPRPIEIQLAARMITPLADNDGIGVTADADGGGSGASCQIKRTGSGDILSAVTSTTTQSTPIATVMPNAEVVLILDYDGTSLRCKLAGNTAQLVLDFPIGTGTMQMVSSIAAQVHWFAIYQADAL